METSLLLSIASLGVLWVGFFWLYRDYRVDLFRERLFRLRDSLFDLARNGELQFSDNAYGMLRKTINGTIRFGHRFGLLDFLFCMLRIRDRDERETVQKYHQNWNEALQELSPQVAEKLRALRGYLHYLVVEQLIYTSLLLYLSVFVPILVLLYVWVVGTALSRLARKVLGDRLVDSIADRLDCAALVASSGPEVDPNGQPVVASN